MRSLRADEVRTRAPQLLELQHAAYAVEAALIGDDRIPPLHETAADLVSAGLGWIAMFDGDQVAGAVGYAVDREVADVDRLVVHPAYHRRGIGAALVTEVLALAARTTVSTGRENLPARALYEALGFVHVSDVEPIPGLWVSRYSHGPTMVHDDRPAVGGAGSPR